MFLPRLTADAEGQGCIGAASPCSARKKPAPPRLLSAIRLEEGASAARIVAVARVFAVSA